MLEQDDIRRYLFDVQRGSPLKKHAAALLIIDMQYYDAHPDYGICKKASEEGQEHQLKYFVERLQQIVPRIRWLQDAFRDRDMEVIHVRIASMTEDGRDRSRQHKEGGVRVPPGSKEAEILDELKPVGDEMVFSKTAGNVFVSTNIDYVLRNMEIEQLVVAGVVTHGCVEDAVRSASGLGYSVHLVEDACASYTEEFHNNAVRELGLTLATVRTADEILQELKYVPDKNVAFESTH